MSDFDQTSLHEELEVRVIALLTGELSETEADELEKILAIDPKLSAYRDRMAELMGELHQASEELAAPEGEPPRRLSEARRARIFGDASVLEPKAKPKRIWFRPAFWGVAASIAMVFAIVMLSSVKFQSAVLREEHAFEAPALAPTPQKEPEYTVNMEQRNRSTPPPRRPAIVVNNPSEMDIPSLDMDVDVDSSSVFGRSQGGGFALGSDQIPAESRSADYARAGETIPVEIPKELIEGTPQPIRVPGLEPAPTEAPRMVVAGKARESGAKEKKQDAVGLSGVREMGVSYSNFGYAADPAGERAKDVDAFNAVPSPSESSTRPEAEQRESPVDGYARSGPVDPFSAPVSSWAEADKKKERNDAHADYASNGPVDAFAAPAPRKQRKDSGGVASLHGRELDEIKVFKGNNASEEEIVMEDALKLADGEITIGQLQQRSSDRSRVSAAPMASLSSDKTKDIVFPELNFKDMPLSRAIESLTELSVMYDRDGVGVNIIPVYKESGNDPKISLSLRNVTLGEAVAKITQAAGYGYEISSDAITIDKDLDATAAPLISNQKSKQIILPQVNFTGMRLRKVVETLQELSVVYDPSGKGIPIEYKPVDGQDPRVNISLRNLSLDRVLQFVTQQVNYEAVDMNGEFIRIQPGGQTEIEKVANARSQKVEQTPKPEKLTAEAPFSTFSLNISDVSFKLAQAALENSRVPPSGQIRTEEFVNSFDYGDPAPRPDEPVSLHWEMAQHPFEHDRQVVRFSLQTQASGRESGQPLNLSLLLDNSGSMQRPDRQAILKNSLQTLEAKLTAQDRLNIILFARQPRLIAEAQTRASQKAAVENALAYRPEGGTNLEAGLKAAYESARRNYLPAGSNRVILLTDGAANLGNVNAGDLADYVVEQRKQGIALDAYGIGWDDYNDALLEEITRNGDGRYAFLNSVEDASEDFSEKLAGTLRVAAANVKVQIEWNPERVQRYRQIGYDLHQLKKEDFRDNTVDAAEIGEAESGTALYVLKIDDDPEIIGGLGTLHVRYLEPASGVYREHSWPLPMPRKVPTAMAASPSIRLAMSSAFFGERLSDSPYASGYNFSDLYSMTTGLPEAFPNQPRVAQMQSMLLQASELYGENK